ncbi:MULTISPECIES: NCS2 family permease [Priestia]|jgi:adenine/guanine/hypoxanthine permease|uniref:Hypoxanthine/guanine permease n=6 Tax=Priestia TaxID=2800373 RepID=D5DZ77_PRIM1|nr:MULTISPECIES: NCS2 family permease [Priestia]AVX07313.1 NCS2 family permease [Bacillus sp. Y-01]KOP73506.1 guanine permease [Bacillus sp. FJAT-21351]KQU26772.1 guanine permease [Bacillus sp. Leaf75]KRE10556.1 guanine permease [Bacillus sp. Root239]KRF53135.1 guanine permease [Bacillus sp. Soil531]MBZ5479260.1 NCS2 family permease [Bacillus sp. T_4]MCF6795069.1 NCS2 family permease [Bacillus sp. ET1]MCL6709797.1 NCS2 family permease [Pseudomonas sp. R2.Fl]MCL9633656.1 NCS2 family permeas
MFKLKEYNTDAKTEILAGITTFLTMIYIVIVNPVILSSAGVPFDQVFTATIISAVVATLWMALAANYPIAIAPGMGMNAYFAALVVGSNGSIDYATAFSAVFVAGIIFIILSLTSFREKLIEAIPNNLKHAISAGIGLFIAFIGLRSAGIIVANKSNLIGLGDLQSEKVVLTLIGLAITIILYTLNVNGALFFGMIITGLIAFFRGQLSFDKGLFASPHLPDGLMISNPFAAFGDVIHHDLYTVVFSFLLVTIFDTTGTMVGVAQQAGLMKGNKMPRVRQALLADSFGTTIGALFGTSPTTAYVESSSGVAAGGRTGLTGVTVAILFIVAAFFSPVVSSVSGVAAITSPALIIVGSLMMGAVAKINWNDFDEAFPAFLVVLAMPLTSSIATGIALGFISYPLMKLVKGKGKQVHPLVYVFAVLFLYQLIFLPH